MECGPKGAPTSEIRVLCPHHVGQRVRPHCDFEKNKIMHITCIVMYLKWKEFGSSCIVTNKTIKNWDVFHEYCDEEQCCAI
jgi:hypothetical protein